MPKRKPFNGRMLYVCVKGSRTIIGVFGSALLEQAKAFRDQDPARRMLWERRGLIQHVGEEMKRGAKPVYDSVILICEDLHTERAGFFRAYVADAPDADTMSPLVGYASSGGSFRTVASALDDARRRCPGTPVYRAFRDGSPSRLLK